MVAMTQRIRRSPGRPKGSGTGKGEPLQLRLHDPFMSRLDDWRAEQRPIPNRQEAIILLAEKAIQLDLGRRN
jgi:hypothetical protein